MPALQGAPVLRAVRNILLDVDITTGIYNQLTAAFGEVGIGRRSTATSRLVASLTLHSNDTRIPAQGLYQWDFTVAVEMFYRVSQDTEAAELMLADAYPAAVHAFFANRFLVDPATGLATVRESKVTGPASNPWYENLSGPEYRMQVLFLNCWRRETFNPQQPVSNSP